MNKVNVNKFLHKFGMMNSQEGRRASRQVDPADADEITMQNLEDEDFVEEEYEGEEEEDPTEQVCQDEACQDDEDDLTPTPPSREDAYMSNYSTLEDDVMGGMAGNEKLGTGYDNTVVVSLTISSVLILALLGWNLGFRRKQRRQNRRWKNDSQKILTRVEDVMTQLEERDEQVDILKQQIKLQQQASASEKEDLQKAFANTLQAKEEEQQNLSATIEQLLSRQRDTDARLEKVTAELNRSLERQQDYECQLLEQKLHASQLSTTITERDVKIEGLQETNATQLERIQELQLKIKSDAAKAETIIGNLTSERDDRFAILQQENDAIKSTIMGMLKTTQAKYDSDKELLKKEMRKRDAKIATLQEDLWKANGLLKRLQANGSVKVDDSLSQSMRNLISDIKQTKDAASATLKRNSTKERRSSTYDAAETILEGNSECAEYKALETLLSN